MAPALVGIERLDLARPDAWVNATGYQGVAERVDDPDRLETIRRYAAELWSDMQGIAPAVSVPAEAPAPAEPVTVVMPVVPAFGAEPVARSLRIPAAAEPKTDVLTVVQPAGETAVPAWSNEPTAALPIQAKDKP
jgi:hypothetical protein